MRTNQGFSVVLILLLSVYQYLSASEQEIEAEKAPVAIAVHIGDTEYESELGTYLYNKVISLLSEQPHITLVDRNSLKTVIEEQRLSQSGFTNSYDILRLGQLKVAQFVLNLKAGSLDKDISLSFTLADTSTGEVVYAKEYGGTFKNLDLPVFIICDSVSMIATDEPIPPPDSLQTVTITSDDLDISYKAISDGKELDGIMYVQEGKLLLNGDKLTVQAIVDGNCLFGFPLPSDMKSLEFKLNELPKHRYQALMRDINLNRLSPFQDSMLDKYGMYGLLIFDMWIYREMKPGDIATFMNLPKDVVLLFTDEFTDIQTRYY